jgi:hypothetical protein
MMNERSTAFPFSATLLQRPDAKTRQSSTTAAIRVRMFEAAG